MNTHENDTQDKDSLRLQWLLDNHRGDFEIKELIAGNFDTYYVETTREAIDKAMNPPTSEKIWNIESNNTRTGAETIGLSRNGGFYGGTLLNVHTAAR